MVDVPSQGGGGDHHSIPRLSAASFPFLYPSSQPPRWAFNCDAGRSLSVEAARRQAKWPLDFPYGFSGCHHVLCCICGPRVVDGRIKRFSGRLERATASGVGLAGLTLTIEPFAAGGLNGQLDALTTAWTKTRTNGPYATISAEHGVVGFLRAVHPSFVDVKWKTHFHVVVAARDAMQAQLAAVALGERYKAMLGRAGLAVNGRTIEVRAAANPEAVAVYYCDIWKSSGDTGLRALFTAALHGDQTACAAYEEMAHALHGRPLTNGSGVLGRRRGA
jgi:hypothetical protein